jgi:hypothetical protein
VWLGVLVLLGTLIAVPRVISYILVQQAERRVAEAIARLPFKLVSEKDLASLWGPAPKPEDNAAPLVSAACRRIEELLAAPAPAATGERPTAEGRPGEPLSVEFERLKVIWGLERVSSYPEDLSPEELRQKAVADEALKKVIANGGGTIPPEALAGSKKRARKAPPKIPPPDLAQARHFLNHFDEVEKLLDEAGRRSGYRQDQNGATADRERQVRDDAEKLVDLLLLECAAEAKEGHWDQAYGRIAQALRLGRLLGQAPESLFARIVIARHITVGDFLPKLLGRHGPSPAEAEELTALLQTDMNRSLHSFLVRECITTHEPFAALLNARTMGADPGTAYAGSGFIRFYLLTDQGVFLESRGRLVKAVDLPWRESVAEITATRDEVLNSRELAGLPLMVSTASLSSIWMVERLYRLDLLDRLFAVAVQVAAYREAHGRYPESLAALPHADQLPLDPYTVTGSDDAGRPLGYRLAADKFLVWSVGPDGKDDDGKTAKELGVEPEAGGDIVLEVPLEPQPGQQSTKPEGRP